MSKAQSLIEQFYLEEQARQAEEATFTPLDISISSADMAIVNTISKRFNKDKGLLVREALTQAFIDMFSALEPVERKLLAKEADEQAKSIAAEIAEEQGLDSLEVTGTNWVTQDKACVKAERQAAKEAEKLQSSMTETAPSAEEALSSIESEASMDAEPANEEMASESEAPFETESATEEESNSIFA